MGLNPNIALLFIVLPLYALYRRYTRISVAKVPGPPSSSLLYGNLGELFQGQSAETEFRWQALYGGVVRLKGPLGDDILLISDPKALQYIYQTAGYRFPKHRERRALSRLLVGAGLVWAEGDVHKRQRKVMHPGFGAPESKAFLPIFSSSAAKMSSKWQDLISASDSQSAVVDIPSWTARATLDAIGEAAFDYQFGALDDADNELTNAYNNVFVDTFRAPSQGNLLFLSISQYLPSGVVDYLVDHAPSPRLEVLRRLRKTVTDVARALVAEKSAALLQGKGSKDIMSLIVKANTSENPATRLTEGEMIAQMQTIILAGHETTANSLSWTLLELSRKPEIQTRLRQEIRSQQREVEARGDSTFTVQDLDSMPYLTAVMKESLRLHAVVPNTFRQAGGDDVLPLLKPIITPSGEVIHELPIPKGIKIITSIAGYNRVPEIFGEDVHSFNPDRWLNGLGTGKAASVGVYANLLTFAGGLRSCIGWRFAVIELQAFLVDLIGNFEFSLTPEAQRVRRETAGVMTPTIEGQVEKGTQLPLRIRVALGDELDD